MKKNINRLVEIKATAVETKAGVNPLGRIIPKPCDY